MPATLRGSFPYDSGASGSLLTAGPLTYPAGVAAGDRAFVAAGNLNASELLLAGFTADAAVTYGAQGGRMFRRICDGTEGGTSINYTQAIGSRTTATLAVVAGAGQPTENLAPNNDGTANLPIPVITPPEDGMLMLVMSVNRQNTPVAPVVPGVTLPTVWTKVYDRFTSNATGNIAGAFFGTRQLGTGTAGVPRTAANAVANTIAAGAVWVFAFPAAGSAGPAPAPTGWDEVRLFNRT